MENHKKKLIMDGTPKTMQRNLVFSTTVHVDYDALLVTKALISNLKDISIAQLT